MPLPPSLYLLYFGRNRSSPQELNRHGSTLSLACPWQRRSQCVRRSHPSEQLGQVRGACCVTGLERVSARSDGTLEPQMLRSLFHNKRSDHGKASSAALTSLPLSTSAVDVEEGRLCAVNGDTVFASIKKLDEMLPAMLDEFIGPVVTSDCIVPYKHILLIDEPTSGLDSTNTRHVWDILLHLRGTSTLFFSTHDMTEADVLADRVVGLTAGILVCNASPTYLKNIYGK
ncbi:hypothetical protein HPB50_027677 [Hyalomma asiaticum]|nr:hypothetical protein HPB50_027677 [Hyalomma asiaticum]